MIGTFENMDLFILEFDSAVGGKCHFGDLFYGRHF